jgi:hypothetical protein
MTRTLKGSMESGRRMAGSILFKKEEKKERDN